MGEGSLAPRRGQGEGECSRVRAWLLLSSGLGNKSVIPIAVNIFNSLELA